MKEIITIQIQMKEIEKYSLINGEINKQKKIKKRENNNLIYHIPDHKEIRK